MTYYVDFPADLEKNRRCYQHAGFKETGERINIPGAATLAMMKKVVDPKRA